MKPSRALGNDQSAELYRLLTAAPDAELHLLLEATPAQPFLAEGNSRMFGSVRSVTAAAITAFPYIDEQTSSAFSVRDWWNAMSKCQPGHFSKSRVVCCQQ
jgi:hypothetical protein